MEYNKRMIDAIESTIRHYEQAISDIENDAADHKELLNKWYSNQCAMCKACRNACINCILGPEDTQCIEDSSFDGLYDASDIAKTLRECKERKCPGCTWCIDRKVPSKKETLYLFKARLKDIIKAIQRNGYDVYDG